MVAWEKDRPNRVLVVTDLDEPAVECRFMMSYMPVIGDRVWWVGDGADVVVFCRDPFDQSVWA